MAPERPYNAPNQLPPEFTSLSAGLRTLAISFYIICKGCLFALRDTILSRLCAWVSSKVYLIESYVPAKVVFVIVHLCLFLFKQPSWRATATTLRTLASRDDADDDVTAKLFVEGLDLMSYVTMSLLFRNIATVWSICAWTFSLALPFLQYLGVISLMFLVMVDNPAQTFYLEVSRAWSIIYGGLALSLQWLGSLVALILRHIILFGGRVLGSMMARGKKRSAIRIAGMEAYQYSTLEPGTIRLLRLSKLAPWSPVSCELIPVHLDTAPKFETISYTWGTAQVMQSLPVNKKRLEVSQKVYDIVHDRATCLMKRYVWIDSICINQHDDNEKSSQVQMMRSIYGSSYHTIAWLGSSPNANDAIGLLAHLRRRIEFDDPVERASRPLTELNIENDGWPSLIELINHDYWVRCWVIQEIAVSQKIIISYGGELVTWEYFFSLIEQLFSSDPNSVWHISKIYGRTSTSRDPIPMDAGLQIASLGRIRDTIRVNQSMTLFDLLIASINSTATDPRDNVFAVLGISAGKTSDSIKPDYTISVESSFLEATQYLLGQEHPSRILHLAGVGFHRNSKLQTSWVPDWSSKRLARMYWRHPTESPYSASNPIRDHVDMTLGSPRSKLTLQGFIVDSIRQTGPRFFGVSENGVPKTNTFPGIFKDYVDSRDMVLRGALSEPYVTGISLTEAFWRTLIGDTSPGNTRPADAAFFKHYQALERFTDALSELYGPQLSSLKPIASSEDEIRLSNSISSCVIDMGRFANIMGPHTRERMFAITERGHMGLVPPYSSIGDVVCIIPGAQVPFLLRPKAGTEVMAELETGNWQLVGESYIHGMMDGEMVSQSQTPRTIVLE